MEWLPSISTTAIFAVAVWLARNLIAARLTKSVQHEFDAKLESLRAEHRKNEELFRADLRAKEAEIAVLRGGAMTAMTSRQVAFGKRRLDAIEQLWSAFIFLAPAKSILVAMSGYDLEKVFAAAPHDAKLRHAFTQMGAGFDETKFDYSTPQKARPFVSPMAWALYSAYQAVVMQAVTKVRLIQVGLGKEFLDKDGIKKLVKAALPLYGTYIEEHGDRGYHFLLEPLETFLLEEIRKMLAGEEDDKDAVAQAAKIMDAVNSIVDATKKSAGSI